MLILSGECSLIADYRAEHPTQTGLPIAAVEHYAHYYPFGMMHPGRNGNRYRFGFNGMEMDDEVAGSGNSYTAEFWQYDSRLGRRWNRDPKTNPSISTYATFANNPIFYTDPFGDTVRYEPGSAEAEAYNKYRDKVFGDDKYKDIQGEILEMEKSTTDFRLRTGDNISSESGGGNTIYNKETGEIDINFKQSGDFSEQQKLAHELKHGSQFLEGKLGFKIDGTADGILNDYQDEYEAYQRQNRFDGPGDKGFLSNERMHSIIRDRYNYDFRTTNKSLKMLSSKEIQQMINTNRGFMKRTGKPKFIYKGYESDL